MQRDNSNIMFLIGQLEEFTSQQELLKLGKQERYDEIVPLEIRQQLADLDAEFADQEQAVTDNIEKLKEQIREAVTLHGETVSGSFLQAVYKAGRDQWDTDALRGYAAAHPEIGQFHSLGKPSVAIQAIRKGGRK